MLSGLLNRYLPYTLAVAAIANAVHLPIPLSSRGQSLDVSTTQADIIVIRSLNVNRAGAPVDCSAYGPTYDVKSHTCLAPVCIVVGSGSCGPYCPGGVSTGMTATPSSDQFCGNTTASSPPTCPFNAGGCISYTFEALFEQNPALQVAASAVLDIIPDLMTCLKDAKIDQPLFSCLGACRAAGGSDLQRGLCIVECPVNNVPSSCEKFFTDAIELPFGLLGEGLAIALLFIHAVMCLVSPCPT